MTTGKGRSPNGASSIYRGKDGKWHGRVTMGTRDDGRPDRRHIEAKTRAEVTRKVRELEKQRDSGRIQRPGRVWTVEQWLTYWVENIAAPFLSEDTLSGYRVAVRVHLIPGVGAHRLDRLQPEHLERLYVRMMGAGSAAGTAHQVHRTIRTARGEAVRRLPPDQSGCAREGTRLTELEVEPYSVEEVQRILAAAGERRNGARWAVAHALGLRQGEALGLRWPDVDLDTGSLAVRRSRKRSRYEHGCDAACGRKSAGYCPHRRQVRADTGDTKSASGRRVIGLPDELVKLLRGHSDEQDRERQLACSSGRKAAGSSPRRPAARSTRAPTTTNGSGSSAPPASAMPACTTPATRPRPSSWVLGVPKRAVMALMGWADTGMAKRYQHVTGQVRRDVAQRVGILLWLTGGRRPDL